MSQADGWNPTDRRALRRSSPLPHCLLPFQLNCSTITITLCSQLSYLLFLQGDQSCLPKIIVLHHHLLLLPPLLPLLHIFPSHHHQSNFLSQHPRPPPPPPGAPTIVLQPRSVPKEHYHPSHSTSTTRNPPPMTQAPRISTLKIYLSSPVALTPPYLLVIRHHHHTNCPRVLTSSPPRLALRTIRRSMLYPNPSVGIGPSFPTRITPTLQHHVPVPIKQPLLQPSSQPGHGFDDRVNAPKSAGMTASSEQGARPYCRAGRQDSAKERRYRGYVFKLLVCVSDILPVALRLCPSFSVFLHHLPDFQSHKGC